MKTRILAGLAMLPLILIFYFRGIALVIAAFLISGMAVYELLRGFSEIKIKGNIFVAWGALVLLYVLHFLAPNRHEYLNLWIVLSVVASLVSIFNIEKHRIADALVTALAIIYVEFFIYHIVLIDETSYGVMVWLVGITSFCTDIAAYFTGYFLGRKKLCPNLSPKKTVEGAIGGVLGSVVSCVVFGLIVKMQVFPHMIILGILGSIMAQLGDLTASAFKRKMGIKDYGNLIPGHGGIMDRFDSIIFAAPTIYYYLQLVIER